MRTTKTSSMKPENLPHLNKELITIHPNITLKSHFSESQNSIVTMKAKQTRSGRKKTHILMIVSHVLAIKHRRKKDKIKNVLKIISLNWIKL